VVGRGDPAVVVRARIYRADVERGTRPARADVIDSLRAIGSATIRELMVDTGRRSVPDIIRSAIRAGIVEEDPVRYQIFGRRYARRYRLATIEVPCLEVLP